MLRMFGRRVAGLMAVVCGGVIGACALAAPAAGAPSGTFVVAGVSASGQLTSSFAWTIQTSASPATQMVPVGSSATVQYAITTAKTAQATAAASFSGRVCLANAGPIATRGLAISDTLRRAGSVTVLSAVTVDVSSRPSLGPWQAACYPFSVAVPGGAITPGASYTNTAHVTITNLVGSQGTAAGPSPRSTGSLPKSATVVGASITVNDSNGQSFTFSSGGTQTYTQAFSCSTVAGAQTINHTNTATIASTGQSASVQATIHCGAPSTVSTALSQTAVNPGGSVSDQATLSGADPNAAGTISYTVYSDSSCQTVFADATPSNNAVSGAAGPASAPVSFPNAGTYWWTATYSGDPNTNTLGSSSGCAAEPLSVSGWQNGDLVTYTQTDWPNDPTASALLSNDFNVVYSTGSVSIGGNFKLRLTTAAAAEAYLPATGTPSALTANLVDPTSSPSGSFGGDVLAAQFDVDFYDTGFLSGSSGLNLGDLTLCNLTTVLGTDDVSSLNGMTVRQVLAAANTVLGGGSTTLPLPYPVDDLDTIVQSISAAFRSGTPSSFAQANLVNGPCT